MYLRPANLTEALDMLAQTRGTILSGGTDLFPAVTGAQLTGTVIDISRIAEIHGIRRTDGSLEIGARTTWTDILNAPLPCGFDGLRAATREIGSIQIQNQATLGGNICNASPAADGVAALLALDAEIVLQSRQGSRVVSLNDFIQGNRKTVRGPDEILTTVRIPRRWENAASSFLKLGARRYLVISIVMVAVNLLVDSKGLVSDAAVCVGSCSPKAVRLRALEQELVGSPIGPELGLMMRSEHFSALSPIDDIRAAAVYRHDAAQILVRRALDECVGKTR